MSLSPWLGIVIVFGALGVLLGALLYLQRRYAPHPETLRKLLHIGMGLVTLGLPWLFDRNWPVWLLAGAAIVLLLGIRWRATTHQSLHQVVHGVARDSLGEIYFPLAVALLFTVSKADPILFCIPILILTLADALAAVIGVHYGRLRYTTAEGNKSIEGSIAFFIVAFLSVHIPLLLFTEVGRAETLLIAALIGLLVMLLEALSWRGLDNLFIPLGAYLLLKVYLPMHSTALSLRLLGGLILLALLVIVRRRSTLLDNAVLAAVLVAYIAWAAGGWEWLLPLLIVYGVYTWLSPRDAANTQRVHDTRAVLAVSVPALLWLFVARQQAWYELYVCYTLSLAAQLGIISLARHRHQYPHMPTVWLLTRCVLQGWLIIGLPWVVISGLFITNLAALAVMGALVALAVIGFFYWQPGIDDCPIDTPRWWRQAVSAGGVSLLGLLIVY